MGSEAGSTPERRPSPVEAKLRAGRSWCASPGLRCGDCIVISGGAGVRGAAMRGRMRALFAFITRTQVGFGFMAGYRWWSATARVISPAS